MSKDIPIIFSGPMVRALLDGRKTMTRRILKNVPPAPAMDAIYPGHEARHPAPYFDGYRSEDRSPDNPLGMSRNWCWWTRDDRQCLPTVNVRFAPGDRLWVRENFAPRYFDGGKPAFAADWTDASADVVEQPKWTPCIHMPRTLSRLTLVVTGVRVERVQDISDADAMAEGVGTWRAGWSAKQAGFAFLRGFEAAEATKQGTVAQRLFYLLWTSLHGEGAWEQNPFVVVPSFRIIKANIDAPEARLAA